MKLILGNIVDMKTDAVVTPAHSDLRPIPGISEAIFKAADTKELTEHCRRIGHCRIGHAVVTPSCGLPSKYIIHVVGPGWYSGHKSERMLFAECYTKALHKATAFHCNSIAIPLMFSGEFHLPRSQALSIVKQVIHHYEEVHPKLDIYLVLYKESIYQLALKIINDSK